MMDKVGMDDETPIEHKWITKAIEKAQKRDEENHKTYESNGCPSKTTSCDQA